jgi:hypothetical protein
MGEPVKAKSGAPPSLFALTDPAEALAEKRSGPLAMRT